jgi:hypothetical protein
VTLLWWLLVVVILIPLLIVYGLTIWDIFTRPDRVIWARIGWLVLVLFLPFVGTVIYIVVFGGHLGPSRNALGRRNDTTGYTRPGPV